MIDELDKVVLPGKNGDFYFLLIAAGSEKYLRFAEADKNKTPDRTYREIGCRFLKELVGTGKQVSIKFVHGGEVELLGKQVKIKKEYHGKIFDKADYEGVKETMSEAGIEVC